MQSGNDGAWKKAEHAVIEVEKFRADIATPPAGNDYNQLNRQVENLFVCGDPPQSDNIVQMNMQNPQQSVFSVTEQPGLLSIGSGLSDDDFFHLTCHIEPSLIHKIEKGEFVELEKLLPKDRMQFTRGGGEENRLEWVQCDGSTYLVSAGRDAKITGIRQWEQAFRAYATIYCAANPQRSKEIWQYISVINTAASAYTWDNVYNNDITFRHLMAFNPNRS